MNLRALKIAVIVGLVGSVMLASCHRDEPLDGRTESFGRTVAANDVFLILSLVNDPATTFTVLDIDAGLNRIAAENIIAHRNGPDGLFGTADDNPFDTLAELDDVPYVGPIALDALLAYAQANPPAVGETVEGVDFTAQQVSAVVWGVNQATLQELDEVVGLDARAAQGLTAGAPFSDIASMGQVAYVGASALNRLRDYAPTWAAARNNAEDLSLAGTFDGVTFDQATAEIALEIANDAGFEELTDLGGMWSTGANRLIDNRPYADLAEVAATPGIGTVTMENLRDFAASGDWQGGGGGTADCDPVFNLTPMSPISDFAASMAAFDDLPADFHYKLASWTVDPCLDLTNSAHLQKVYDTAINFAQHWPGWVSEFPHMFEYETPSASSGRFTQLTNYALTVMSEKAQERVNNGDPTAQDTYDGIAAWHAQVVSLVEANPAETRSLVIHLEASECSEDVAVVIDPVLNTMHAIHAPARYCY
jgi:DNA uptake protein ComE-like DNA-binding protein